MPIEGKYNGLGVPELRFIMMNIGTLWLTEMQNLGISEQQSWKFSSRRLRAIAVWGVGLHEAQGFERNP